MTSTPPQPPDEAGVVERLALRLRCRERDKSGCWCEETCDLDAIRAAFSSPPGMEEAGQGFDAAVAAIEAWADGFIEPSDTAKHLRLTAKDLRRNREIILAALSPASSRKLWTKPEVRRMEAGSANPDTQGVKP